MKTAYVRGSPFTPSEGSSSDCKTQLRSLAQPIHMNDDDFVATHEGAIPHLAAPHDESRAMVRLVQCPKCSRPFKTPVTLPCGHSVCRDCLPQPHTRLNISYPATPDRRTGIWCPVASCQEEHPVGEVNVDVTLSKIMDHVLAEVDDARATADATQTGATVIPAMNEALPPPSMGEMKWLYGGRLLATFMLADLNELDYDANVIYTVRPQFEEAIRKLDTVLLDRLHQQTIKELDCQICYNVMYDPVTTSCGHTYCRRCLTRVLDHSRHCPSCRRGLQIPSSLSQQKSNAQIEAFLQKLCPDAVAARAEAVALEESSGTGELDVPLFICTLSFPTMPTFLHIFEPRYRLMMRRAVDGNGQFGMLMYNRTRQPQGEHGSPNFCQYGTMLQIMHMQMLPDGRSIIESRGMYRFRVKKTGMRDGYMVGSIDRMEDVSLAEEERFEAEEIRVNANHLDSPLDGHMFRSSNSLRGNISGSGSGSSTNPPIESMSTHQLFTRATDFIVEMRSNSAPWLHQRILEAYGEPPADPASFPYWFASVLPIADEEKYVLLTTTSVRQRLKIVVGWIRRLQNQRWYSGSNCIVL